MDVLLFYSKVVLIHIRVSRKSRAVHAMYGMNISRHIQNAREEHYVQNAREEHYIQNAREGHYI